MDDGTVLLHVPVPARRARRPPQLADASHIGKIIYRSSTDRPHMMIYSRSFRVDRSSIPDLYDLGQVAGWEPVSCII